MSKRDRQQRTITFPTAAVRDVMHVLKNGIEAFGKAEGVMFQQGAATLTSTREPDRAGIGKIGPFVSVDLALGQVANFLKVEERQGRLVGMLELVDRKEFCDLFNALGIVDLATKTKDPGFVNIIQEHKTFSIDADREGVTIAMMPKGAVEAAQAEGGPDA